MTTQTPPQYVAPPSRPLGVAILAILVGILGFLVIITGLLIIAAATIPTILGVPSSFIGVGGLTWGLAVLIVGLILLGLALGLYRLRMWALVLSLIFVFVELLGAGLAGNFVSFDFILSLILFVYLLAVHGHFR